MPKRTRALERRRGRGDRLCERSRYRARDRDRLPQRRGSRPHRAESSRVELSLQRRREWQFFTHALGRPGALALEPGVYLGRIELVVGERGPKLHFLQPAEVLAKRLRILTAGIPGGNDFPDVEPCSSHHGAPSRGSIREDYSGNPSHPDRFRKKLVRHCRPGFASFLGLPSNLAFQLFGNTNSSRLGRQRSITSYRLLKCTMCTTEYYLGSVAESISRPPLPALRIPRFDPSTPASTPRREGSPRPALDPRSSPGASRR